MSRSQLLHPIPSCKTSILFAYRKKGKGLDSRKRESFFLESALVSKTHQNAARRSWEEKHEQRPVDEDDDLKVREE
jgi:hypothetical protein